MKTHKNAREILPDHLLKELQKYVSGEALYIPKVRSKKPWGETSGARNYYKQRNEEIRKKYSHGSTVDTLAEEYKLSVDSIRKILYQPPLT